MKRQKVSRDVRIAQRALDRVRWWADTVYPFVRLLSACDECQLVQAFETDITRFAEKAAPGTRGKPFDGPRHEQQQQHFGLRLARRLESEVARWVWVHRFLAGDQRVLTLGEANA